MIRKILIASLIILGLPIFVLAQNNSNIPTLDPIGGDNREDAEAVQADQALIERITNNCEMVKQKIAAHNDNLSNFKTKHNSVLARVNEKLDRIVSRVDATDNLDSTELKVSVDAFSELQSTFISSLAVYEVATDNLNNSDCADQEKGVMLYDELGKLRNLHGTLKANLDKLSAHLRTDVAAALNNLKTQIMETASSEADSEENSNGQQ